ncbi:MAG: ABC transporter substrate-binding protein [Sulfuricaulis sp.]|nr:ABC transporter substrate-binding protein [Sulfuricaulis sp.]
MALTAGSALAQTVQGVSDTEILIGSHQDLSGPIASTGAPIRELMQFAVDDVNAAGGIHGRKLRLIVEDSSYDTKKAVLATQKLLTQDKVFALVATLGSPTSLASMPLAIDRGIPFLFPAAASDSGYLPFHPLKFGLMTPYSDQTRAAVKFAYDKLGKRRFGVLYQDDDNGQNLLQALVSELKTLGMAPIEATNFKRGEFEFSAQIARLKAADVDVIILGTSGARDTAGAAIETKKLGWNVDMIAGVGASNETVIRLGGKAVEGLYATFQFLNSTQPMTPALRTALDRFKTRYGHDAGDGMLGYNAVMLFAEGAKNAGRNLTPQTLTQGLEKIKNFTTVFAGPAFTYGPGNHNPPNTPIMMKVKDGKYVPVL